MAVNKQSLANSFKVMDIETCRNVIQANDLLPSPFCLLALFVIYFIHVNATADLIFTVGIL